MATYPSGVYDPRTKKNKDGIVYDEAKNKVLFAEDLINLDNEVVAIEQSLLNQLLTNLLPNSALLEWTGSIPDWWWGENATLEKIRGAFSDALKGGICAKVTPTAQYGGLFCKLQYADHNTLFAGKTYRLYFRYKVSNTNATPRVLVQLGETPWTCYGTKNLTSTNWVVDYIDFTIATGEGHDNNKSVDIVFDCSETTPFADIYLDWVAIVPTVVSGITAPPPYYKAIFQ